MSSPQCSSSQNQLADRMPRTTKRIIFGGVANADSHATVGRDNFKDDVKCREGHGITVVIGRFGNGNEENGKGDEPNIVAQLRSDFCCRTK